MDSNITITSSSNVETSPNRVYSAATNSNTISSCTASAVKVTNSTSSMNSIISVSANATKIANSDIDISTSSNLSMQPNKVTEAGTTIISSNSLSLQPGRITEASTDLSISVSLSMQPGRIANSNMDMLASGSISMSPGKITESSSSIAVSSSHNFYGTRIKAGIALGDQSYNETLYVTSSLGENIFPVRSMSQVPVLTKNTITNQYLLHTKTTGDGSIAASEIIYTLHSKCTWGKLLLNNAELEIGDTWTQEDINNNNLSYLRINKRAAYDYFTFRCKHELAEKSLVTYTIDLVVNPMVRVKSLSRYKKVNFNLSN